MCILCKLLAILSIKLGSLYGIKCISLSNSSSLYTVCKVHEKSAGSEDLPQAICMVLTPPTWALCMNLTLCMGLLDQVRVYKSTWLGS